MAESIEHQSKWEPNIKPSDPHETSAAPSTEARLVKVESEVEALTDESIGQEHRLVQVVRNAYFAVRGRASWSRGRRMEAGGALVRYFLVGRTTLVIGLSIGGLLALHASFMLADQNKKLDLQNYLSIVSGELAEAQRNSQFVQLIGPLVAEVQVAVADIELGDGGTRALPPELGIRLAVLTQTFQPYRWTYRDMVGENPFGSSGEGFLYDALTQVRGLYDAGFGQSRMKDQLAEAKIPVLTEHRMSPERGFLLVNLHALGIDFRELTRYNVTFESAHAPNARLSGINLRRLEGPGAASDIDLSGSNLSGATFERASLDGVNLILGNLTLTTFNGASCVNTRFDRANVDQASFVSTRLEGAIFENAYIAGSKFDYANLANAKLTNTRGFDEAHFEKSCLSRYTTQMPTTFRWESYEVPSECCSLWTGLHEPFSQKADGMCEAIDGPDSSEVSFDSGSPSSTAHTRAEPPALSDGKA